MSQDEKMVEELQKIRELLTPKPPPPPPVYPKGIKGIGPEFKDFLLKYKVLGLAVAFIMGLYLGSLVQALASDLLLPLIGLMIPGLADFSTLELPLGTQFFKVGHFLAAVITFIIVAFVIFIIVKLSRKWGLE
jgi:large conductance mechanosensitive channel